MGKKLNSDPDTDEIPVILISALDRIALEAGADAFIIKPFDILGLSQAVDRYTRE